MFRPHLVVGSACRGTNGNISGQLAIVQSLPPQTRVQVKTDSHKTTCLITAVTDDKLTCSQSVLSRAEIKTIRLTNKAKSTVTGLLIGAGAGSGVGAGIGSAINAGK
jgi:hypothetical protein